MADIPICHPTASHWRGGSLLARSNTRTRRQQRRQTGSRRHCKPLVKLSTAMLDTRIARQVDGLVRTLRGKLQRASSRAKAPPPSAAGKRRRVGRRRVRAVAGTAWSGQSWWHRLWIKSESPQGKTMDWPYEVNMRSGVRSGRGDVDRRRSGRRRNVSIHSPLLTATQQRGYLPSFNGKHAEIKLHTRLMGSWLKNIAMSYT